MLLGCLGRVTDAISHSNELVLKMNDTNKILTLHLSGYLTKTVLINALAAEFSIKMTDLLGRCIFRKYILPEGLAKELPKMSLPGGRNLS